jgi:hypothetical protein
MKATWDTLDEVMAIQSCALSGSARFESSSGNPDNQMPRFSWSSSVPPDESWNSIPYYVTTVSFPIPYRQKKNRYSTQNSLSCWQHSSINHKTKHNNNKKITCCNFLLKFIFGQLDPHSLHVTVKIKPWICHPTVLNCGTVPRRQNGFSINGWLYC